MKLILGFIGVVAALWLLWFFSGGPRKFEEDPQGKFIKPLQIDREAETYN